MAKTLDFSNPFPELGKPGKRMSRKEAFETLQRYWGEDRAQKKCSRIVTKLRVLESKGLLDRDVLRFALDTGALFSLKFIMDVDDILTHMRDDSVSYAAKRRGR